MSRVLAAIWMLLSVGAAHADGRIISEITEAGIYDCEASAPDELGPRFYQSVRNACLGRASCTIAATEVASEEVLRSHGCTGIFVLAICDSHPPHEFSLTGLADRLEINCEE